MLRPRYASRITVSALVSALAIVLALAAVSPSGAQGADVQIAQLSCSGDPELVVIENFGDAAQTLTGWELQSDPPASEIFDLSVLGGLAPGASVSIQSGPSASGVFKWSLDEIFRDNDATDYVRLVDDTGAIVDQVNCGPDAPAADNVIDTTDEDTADTWFPSVSDPDTGDTLTCTADATSTNGGTVIVTLDCSSGSYTPAANFNGSDTFSYTVSDGTLTDDATVSYTVNPVNDPPIAANISATHNEDIPVIITLSATDIDGCELTFPPIVTPPANGSLSGIGTVIGACVAPPEGGASSSLSATVTYTPNANFVGSDSFTYKANDGALDSNIATVIINVLADSDGDGVPDSADNCPNDPNAEQADADSDGIGDACEPAPSPPTPTTTTLAGVQLPTAGGLPPSEGGDSLTPLFYILLAGAALIVVAAIAVGRWRLSAISTKVVGTRDGQDGGWTWESGA